MCIHDNPFEHVGYIEIKEEKPFVGRAISGMKRYGEPSFTSKQCGYVANGNVVEILKVEGEWGQLDDKSWIHLKNIKKL